MRDYSAAVAKEKQTLVDYIQQGMNKVSQQEKLAIKSKWLIVENVENVITFSYSNNQMPFSGNSSAGVAQGFFIELWQMWAKSSGLEIKFVMGDLAEFNQTNINMADVHITSMTNEQANNSSALGPVIYRVNYGLFVSNDTKEVLHTTEIKGKNVGVVRIPSFEKDIQNKITSSTVIYFDDYTTMFAAAERGELDVIAGQVDIIESYLIEYKLQSVYTKLNSYSFKQDVHAMLNKVNPKLSKLIVKGFESLPLEDLVSLENKWHLDGSSGFFNNRLTALALTDKEIWCYKKLAAG